MTTLAEDYLQQFSWKAVWNYHHNLERGQRIGQAFFNALPEHKQHLLEMTLYDPFYKNDSGSVEKAIEFLLDNQF